MPRRRPTTLARTVDAGQLAADPVNALAPLPLVAYGEELPIIRRYWRSEVEPVAAHEH
ncbi:hypothetical protein [Streptomyces sp. 7N604]|uniref:hypothetical protein n=1 Tax=Streptomyces sp. 7N604 TaxID=3457415 RepID=UPI003FD6A3F6